MARRSYGSGSLVVRADANGAETWYGLWRTGPRRVKRALGPKRAPASRHGLTRSQAEAELPPAHAGTDRPDRPGRAQDRRRGRGALRRAPRQCEAAQAQVQGPTPPAASLGAKRRRDRAPTALAREAVFGEPPEDTWSAATLRRSASAPPASRRSAGRDPRSGSGPVGSVAGNASGHRRHLVTPRALFPWALVAAGHERGGAFRADLGGPSVSGELQRVPRHAERRCVIPPG